MSLSHMLHKLCVTSDIGILHYYGKVVNMDAQMLTISWHDKIRHEQCPQLLIEGMTE